MTGVNLTTEHHFKFHKERAKHEYLSTRRSAITTEMDFAHGPRKDTTYRGAQLRLSHRSPGEGGE